MSAMMTGRSGKGREKSCLQQTVVNDIYVQFTYKQIFPGFSVLTSMFGSWFPGGGRPRQANSH